MMFLFLILASILAAIWFQRELKQFPKKINQQIFQDMASLITLPFSLAQFMTQSKLTSKKRNTSFLFFLLFPITIYIFNAHSLFIVSIIFILIYLSVVDYHYYLTDIHYISLIFFLSLCEILFVKSEWIEIHLTTLVITILFFSLFIPFTKMLFKKETLGSGDVILFIALSPLFDLTMLFQLLLFASLFGLGITGIYRLIYKKRLNKLPFIPFISAAATILIYFSSH